MRKIIGICDDEAGVCEDLRGKLLETGIEQDEIVTFQSPESLRKYMKEENDLDILFLDIVLKEQNGIQVAVELQNHFPQLAIIFITGYIDYAKDIFKAVPAYFLVKPIQTGEVRVALERTRMLLAQNVGGQVSFLESGKRYTISAGSIHYAESQNRTIKIVTAQRTYKTYMKLDEFQRMLPANFLRSHKSFLVNMNYIAYFSSEGIELYDHMKLPVSRRKYQKSKEYYMDFYSTEDDEM
ncbi:MAG: response regulator transcription factor [Clostridia bacterium]|nr:response regulator transcription factor [Clostridia bacterium]